MLGRTNATIPLFNINTDLQYSYDGQLWKPFKPDGTDIGKCVSMDTTTNILTVKQSGFYYLNGTVSDANIRYIRYATAAASYTSNSAYNAASSSPMVYQRNPNTFFYLKIMENSKINVCCVGGGGSGGSPTGAGTQDQPGGGGGSGGTVSYNIDPIPVAKNTILKIQVGDKGRGPGDGCASSIYLFNPLTGETELLVTSPGGMYGRSSAAGAGTAESTTDNFYSKRSAGGAGGRSGHVVGYNGAAGTTWPINNVTYGGGGGGAGRYYGEYNGYSGVEWTQYGGGSAGSGGGGHGDTTGAAGVDFYGGGGGGLSGNKSIGYFHHFGGSGICLINFV